MKYIHIFMYMYINIHYFHLLYFPFHMLLQNFGAPPLRVFVFSLLIMWEAFVTVLNKEKAEMPVCDF